MSSSEETIDVAAIRARVNAATEGPWTWSRSYEIPNCDGVLSKHWALHNPVSASEGRVCNHNLVTHTAQRIDYDGVTLDESPDFQFIAHARTDIPSLLDVVASLTTRLRAAEQRCEWVAAALHGDPLFGPATEEPLYQQVVALRNAWMDAKHDADTLRRAIREAPALAYTFSYPVETSIGVQPHYGELFYSAADARRNVVVCGYLDTTPVDLIPRPAVDAAPGGATT